MTCFSKTFVTFRSNGYLINRVCEFTDVAKKKKKNSVLQAKSLNTRNSLNFLYKVFSHVKLLCAMTAVLHIHILHRN